MVYVCLYQHVCVFCLLDLMMGNAISEDLLKMARTENVDLASPTAEVEEWTMEREESVAYSITKCQQLLVPAEQDAEGWAVVEYGPW